MEDEIGGTDDDMDDDTDGIDIDPESFAWVDNEGVHHSPQNHGMMVGGTTTHEMTPPDQTPGIQWFTIGEVSMAHQPISWAIQSARLTNGQPLVLCALEYTCSMEGCVLGPEEHRIMFVMDIPILALLTTQLLGYVDQRHLLTALGVAHDATEGRVGVMGKVPMSYEALEQSIRDNPHMTDEQKEISIKLMYDGRRKESE